MITLDDASGELVRVCWPSVNVRGEVGAAPADGDAGGDDPAGLFPAEETSTRNTVPFTPGPGAADRPGEVAVPGCAGRRGECVYSLPPAIPDGPTCLNVDCGGRGSGGAYEAVVDMDTCGRCGCSGLGGTMMGDGSAEVGFDTGDGGEVRVCAVG